MRIADLYARGRPVVSFEFFPPKTDAGYRTLYRSIGDLERFEPGYVSVTMGAGGSTRTKTLDLVVQIQRDIGITALTHLPCVGFERAEIAALLDRLAREGLENLLALSGDPPGETASSPPADGFRWANELVDFAHSRWQFCIGGGCHPETHPAAKSPQADLRNLKRKVEAGTDFLISQLFFDNDRFFAFVKRARAAGIEVPIVPGIMPVTSAAGVRRMASLSGAQIPDELAAELSRVAGDDDATLELGVRWATLQCRELLDRDVPGLHFYTLNRSRASHRIYENLFGNIR